MNHSCFIISINLYLKFLQYDKVIAYLIVIFIVVIVIDFLSIYARSYFNEEGDVSRPNWLSVFLPNWIIGNSSNRQQS